MSEVEKPVEKIKWGVVATVREPADLVLAFVAHHLELGADEIVLYLDDPEDEVFPILRRTGKVRAVRCDWRYWDRLTDGKGRPGNQNQRQAKNATQAYKTTKCDYLIHLDADEFLYLARPIEEEVARLEGDECWLRVPAMERCWQAGNRDESIFGGVFRSQIRNAPKVVRNIYGDEVVPFLSHGLAGAAHGKPLVRVGEQVSLQVHAAKLPGKNAGWAPHRRATGLTVLHFDGLTPLHWVAKTLRYAEQDDAAIDDLLHDARARQVRAARDLMGSMPELLRFFRQITGLSPEQASALTAHGKLAALEFDPAAAVKRVFPDHVADYSFRAFDLKLGTENARRLMKVIGAPPRRRRPEGTTKAGTASPVG